MAGTTPHSAYFAGAQNFRIDHQVFNIRSGEDLICQLNPIPDASHTRNRKRSPPDSECFPGTRQKPIQEVVTWVDSQIVGYGVLDSEDAVPHIFWLHGFAGCGKSSVSLEVARIYAGSGRLLASYFFYRGAGDRGTMTRFAATLASQLVVTIPATAPFIEKAVGTHRGLLSGDTPLTMQLEELVFNPLLMVIEGNGPRGAIAAQPFLILIDGLDECEDKEGVEDLIDYLLEFFDRHPAIPLRIFIASRVEQHIRERLEVDGVWVGNLDSHSPNEDLEKFLRASFQAAAKRDRVIQAYIRARGSWPTKSDMDKLVKHVRGSFVLAATLFKFVIQPATEDDPTTPMERLPLALKMNGLDGLYARILARSQHLPHFHDIISTIALLARPLPIMGIAGLLKIEPFEVIPVLLNLQAIIHVPGTDEEGQVTVCHSSLRDFLTTESRSGAFFVPPSFHLCLSYISFSCTFENYIGPAWEYAQYNLDYHWRSFAQSDSDFFNKIEQFKGGQSLHGDRIPHCAFLCNMFFYSLIRDLSPTPDGHLHLLTECTEQLALAAECPDPRIRLWLEKALYYVVLEGLDYRVQFTEDTYQTVQRNLQHAANTIRSNYPDILEHWNTSTGTQIKHVVDWRWLEGIDIFKVLEWIVTRAHFKWEEAKIMPQLPLTLSINISGWDVMFSFDRA